MNTSTKKLLSQLFVPRNEGLEGMCFSMDSLDEKNTELHAVQQAVSDAQYDSNLSFNFSYVIGEKACDILSEVDWDNEDAINEAIDNAVPVYTNELMEIYTSDAWIVDEACEDGSTDYEDANTSEKRAQRGWYMAISDMVESIKSKLS